MNTGPLREARQAIGLLWSPGFLGIVVGLFAILSIVFALTAPDSVEALRGVWPVSYALLAVLVMSGVPRLVWLLREVRQLRLPAGQSRVLRGALTLIVPFLLVSVVASILAPGRPLAWLLAGQLCIIAASASLVLWPFTLAILTFSMLPLVLKKLGRARLALPMRQLAPSHPMSALWLLLIAAALGAVAVYCARRMIRRDRPDAGWSSSLAEKFSVNSASVMAVPKDANAFTRQTPSWLLPRVDAAHARGALSRVLTLLGPPFAPGYALRNLAFMAVVWAIVLPANAQSQGPRYAGVVFGLSIGVMAVLLQYAQRVRLVWRRDCGELAELALLPGAASSSTGEATLLGAAVLRALAIATGGFIAMSAVLTIVLVPLRMLLGGEPVAVTAAQLALNWLTLIPGFGLAAFLQGVLLIGLLARGRPLIKGIGLWMFVYLAGQAVLAVLLILIQKNFTTLPLLSRWTLLLAGALLLFAIARLGLRWYAQLRALPHPWLPASERRHHNTVGGPT